jgi:hypothetical protein
MTKQDQSKNKFKKATKGIRWMSWQQEAKKDAVKLRKVTGSCYTSFDPWVSEWGNLGARDRVNRKVSKVALQERTQGTETSKYLQEKKSKEILLVAASESRRAQT